MTTNFYALRTDILCKIESDLNSWKWPTELGAKPNNWDALPVYSKDKSQTDKYSIISPIRKLIVGIVGEKATMHYHHIHNLGRTEEEFENWWNVRRVEVEGVEA